MDEKEMRNFALRDERSPYQAALKVANRGHTDIKLEERGHGGCAGPELCRVQIMRTQ
jgi:hypothetical protein